MEIDLRENPTFREVREFFKQYDISIVDAEQIEALKRENEELKAKLEKAKDIIKDMEKGYDAKAFKEARKFIKANEEIE